MKEFVFGVESPAREVPRGFIIVVAQSVRATAIGENALGSQEASPLDRCTRLAYNVGVIFIETHIFTSRITQSVSDEDYHKLQVHLTSHPDAGKLIRGSGGIRKIRCATSGRGKRGGARTLYYWDVPDRIYMIFCYLKNERENITPEQLKTLRKLVEENLK